MATDAVLRAVMPLEATPVLRVANMVFMCVYCDVMKRVTKVKE